jgi:CRP-like cAMP-binding protein
MQTYSRKTRDTSLLKHSANLWQANSLKSRQCPKRSILENQVIQNNLSKMPRISCFTQNSESEYLLLSSIAAYVRFERVSAKKLLFKYGDENDKFYIIFEGSVGVLHPTWEDVEMTFEEFVVYLARLSRLGEKELFNQCKVHNKTVFPVDFSDLDSFLENIYSKREITDEGKEEIKKSLHAPHKRTNIGMNFSSKGFEIFLQSSAFNQYSSQDTDFNLFYKSVESIEDYIKETSPLVFKHKGNWKKRRLVKICLYYLDKLVNYDNYFIENSLLFTHNKRYASVITNEECLLAVLDKSQYENIMQETFDKINKNHHNFLINTQLFVNCGKNVFMRYFTNMFIPERALRNQVILNENTTNKWVIIIKEGEYEVKTKRSLNEVDLIVKSLNEKMNLDYDKELKSKFKLKKL